MCLSALIYSFILPNRATLAYLYGVTFYSILRLNRKQLHGVVAHSHKEHTHGLPQTETLEETERFDKYMKEK